MPHFALILEITPLNSHVSRNLTFFKRAQGWIMELWAECKTCYTLIHLNLAHDFSFTSSLTKLCCFVCDSEKWQTMSWYFLTSVGRFLQTLRPVHTALHVMSQFMLTVKCNTDTVGSCSIRCNANQSQAFPKSIDFHSNKLQMKMRISFLSCSQNEPCVPTGLWQTGRLQVCSFSHVIRFTWITAPRLNINYYIAPFCSFNSDLSTP